MVKFIKRNWFEVFVAIWLIAYTFLPFRPEPLAQVELSSKGIAPYLFTIWQFIPLCFIIILLVTIAKKKELPIKLKWLQYAALIILPLTLMADILAGQVPLVWGTVGSGGLMIAITLLTAKRFMYLGEFRALLIGGIWAFTFVYGWEVMYQFILLYKSNFNIPAFASVIINNVIIILPFLFLFMFYKIQFNQANISLLIVFGLAVMVWGLTGFNTLIYYDGTSWQPEEMIYPSYVFSRLSKVLLGLCLLPAIFAPKVLKERATKTI